MIPFADHFGPHENVAGDDTAEGGDIGVGAALGDALDYVLAFEYAAEDGETAVHGGLRRQRDEELAARGIGFVGINHAERATKMFARLGRREFIGDEVAGVAGA